MCGRSLGSHITHFANEGKEKDANLANKCSLDLRLRFEITRDGGDGGIAGCVCLCIWSWGVYKNVLNAIMEDGEATVLGLRRSKPLFFLWEGAFLIQNSTTKDFQ